eukprot:763193-Hanusia_phi.AAC.4
MPVSLPNTVEKAGKTVAIVPSRPHKFLVRIGLRAKLPHIFCSLGKSRATASQQKSSSCWISERKVSVRVKCMKYIPSAQTRSIIHQVAFVIG